MTSQNASLWRNVLLLAACLSLVAALWAGFRFESVPPTTGVGVLVGCLFAALGIRDLARCVFGRADEPWYGHIGAVLFIGFMMWLIIGGVSWAIRTFLDQGIARGIPLPQAQPLILAGTLVWILLLDWVPCERPARPYNDSIRKCPDPCQPAPWRSDSPACAAPPAIRSHECIKTKCGPKKQ